MILVHWFTVEVKCGTRFKLTLDLDNSSITGFNANAEPTEIEGAVVNLLIDEATLDNIEIYIVPDTSYPQYFLIGWP